MVFQYGCSCVINTRLCFREYYPRQGFSSIIYKFRYSSVLDIDFFYFLLLLLLLDIDYTWLRWQYIAVLRLAIPCRRFICHDMGNRNCYL